MVVYFDVVVWCLQLGQADRLSVSWFVDVCILLIAPYEIEFVDGDLGLSSGDGGERGVE